MSIDRAAFKTTDPLADFSTLFYNETVGYIADDIFPIKTIPKAQFKLYQYTKDSLRYRETRRSSGSEASEIEWSAFTRPDLAILHKLKARINPQDERDADAAVSDFDTDAVRFVTEGLQIAKESEAMALVTDSTKYASGLSATLAADKTWASDAGDSETDVNTARLAVFDACGQTADSAAMSYRTLNYLQQSPALKDRLKYTAPGAVPVDLIKNLFMVKNLYVSEAKYNNANDGAADSLTDIMLDYCVIFKKGVGPDLRGMQFGRNFMVNNWVTKTFDDPKLSGPAGNIRFVELQVEYILRAAAVDASGSDKFIAGYLISNTY